MNTLDHIFEWLLQASLRASFLTVAVLLIQRALWRHLSARWQYALWLPVLIVLLMPALVESRWSAESLLVVAEPRRQVLAEVPVGPAPINHTPVPAQPEPMIQIGWQHVWLIGALGLVITGLTSFTLALRRFRKNACTADAELLAEIEALAEEIGLLRAPQVCLSSAISSPAVTGVFRPILLLPSGFREAFTTHEARLVLKHELMHLKRGDLLMNTLLCVLMALQWFNPLLWLAFFKARIDREAACDEDVLRHDSPADRATYGHVLLKAESAFCPRAWSLGFVGIFDRGTGLRTRIRSIAQARHTPGKMAALTLGIMAVLTFLGTTRAQVADGKQADEKFVSLEIMIAELSEQTGDFSGQIKTMLESREHSQVLSAADEKELRTQIAKSRDSKVTSYPRMVTRLGQEASIRSVVNQPVPDEKQKSGISYLPIGLIFNLMPTKSGDKMRLKYDLTDSRIIGEEQTPKGPMPIVKSYHNQSSVELEDGHTLALWNQEERRLYTVRQALVSGSDKLDTNGPALISDAETKAKELRRAAPQQYDFVRAHLGDVLRYIATDAGIPFISLPDDQPITRKAITFSLRSSPFEVLETICRTHGLVLHLDQDVWQFRLASGNEAGSLPHEPEPSPSSLIQKKLQSIVLPQVQFSGATLLEAIEFFRVKSRMLDTSEPEVSKRGVNFMMQGGSATEASISMDLKDVPLSDVVKYTADLAGMEYRIEENFVVFLPGSKDSTAKPPAPINGKAVELAKKYKLPQVQFSKATLEEAVEFVRIKVQGREDNSAKLNVILKPGGNPKTQITLNLKDISVWEALRYIAELSNHTLSADDHTIILTPR
jgi:beta-lactamase regulating signal transducer with metallopeptidase domain